jgi:hypothetical protein
MENNLEFRDWFCRGTGSHPVGLFPVSGAENEPVFSLNADVLSGSRVKKVTCASHRVETASINDSVRVTLPPGGNAAVSQISRQNAFQSQLDCLFNPDCPIAVCNGSGAPRQARPAERIPSLRPLAPI